jgi:hypothetical protein
MLSPGNDNNVNGLPVWPVDPPLSKAPWLTKPTVRQLSLLEQAVNACTYDWDRLRKIGLGHASVQVTWVNAEYLYAGHIGTVSLEKAADINLPDGLTSKPAFAPVTRPYGPSGQLGDYGGAHIRNGFSYIYLLNTLDQDPTPYGGARFYMETVIRLLGLITTYHSFSGAASSRDRIARCLVPSDRPDFETYDVSHPRSSRIFVVPPGTPGAIKETRIWSQYYGKWVLSNPPENDPRCFATSRWFFESNGIESRWLQYPPLEIEAMPGNSYPPDYPYGWSMTWGFEPSPIPAPQPWHQRLFEGAAETFKDIFLDRHLRRGTNRTAVKLRSGRSAWEQFVSLYMDEIPPPVDAQGLTGLGPAADRSFLYAIHPPDPPQHPDSYQVLSGGTIHESFSFYVVPDLGDDNSIVTLEVLPGRPGRSGAWWEWFTRVNWSGPPGQRADSLNQYAATVSGVLPLRLEIPKSAFADTRLLWNITGNYNGPGAGQTAQVDDLLYGFETNAQEVMFATMAGQSGLSADPRFQLFKYRVTLPTKSHPRYPAGLLGVDGADAGTRRNGRPSVGSDIRAHDTGLPPLRPPGAGRPEHRHAAPSRYGDHGVATT